MAIGVPISSLYHAMAQDAASPSEPTKMEKVVVTGSNIPTAETVTASPVDVFNAAEIQKVGAGAQTVPQLLKRLPSTVGSGNFSETRGNGGDGSAQVSLRGIPGGTLVLVNGRRVAPNGFAGSTVDLNTIPLGAIERIELLKDGASAMYGSDAIAGVVNVILKKDYNGTEVNAYYGNTTEKDMGQQSYSFITGFADDKTSMVIGGSYYKSDALYSVDRARSFPSPSTVSGTSNPGRIRTTAANDPADIIPNAGLVYAGAPGTTPTGLADFRPYNAATDTFPYAFYTPAVRPSERYSIFGNGERKLFGDNLVFFTETSYTHTWSYNQLAPTPIVFGNYGVVIPTTNPYNVLGVPISNLQYRTLELGPRTDVTDADAFRFLAGLKGRVLETSWNWETGFLYSQDVRREKEGGDVNLTALRAGVADTNPATAFNPFGNRANTPAQLAGLGQVLAIDGKSTLLSIDLKAHGEVFNLPAGPIEAALGGEHREERGESIPDGTIQRGDTVGFNSGQTLRGSRDIYALFGETKFPIFSPQNEIPAFHSLEIGIAARFEHYSDYGDEGNPRPKFNIRWQPIDDSLTIRGSFSQSFRAPTFSDLYTGQQESYPNVRNPFKVASADPAMQAAAYDQQRTFYYGSVPFAAAFPGSTLAVGGLKPQTSDNYAAGVVYSPKFLKGLTLNADFYQIDRKNVPGGSAQYIIDRNYQTGGATTATAGGLYSELLNFDPLTLDYNSISVPTLNLSRQRVKGVDWGVTYEVPTDSFGKFTFIVQADSILTFEQEDIPGSGMKDKLGDFTNDDFGYGSIPRLKGYFQTLWEYKNLELGVTVNYISSYLDDKLATWPDGTPANREIAAWDPVDLQASYKFPYDTKVTIGVINVADDPPPLALGAFADNYDRDLHDLRGRFIYMSLNKKF